MISQRWATNDTFDAFVDFSSFTRNDYEAWTVDEGKEYLPIPGTITSGTCSSLEKPEKWATAAKVSFVAHMWDSANGYNSWQWVMENSEKNEVFLS